MATVKKVNRALPFGRVKFSRNGVGTEESTKGRVPGFVGISHFVPPLYRVCTGLKWLISRGLTF
jgi:hypothetical protein